MNLVNCIFVEIFYPMIIRKGTPNDMPSVLELIKELAIFEKEPDAVVVTGE
jgi:hypothetical protein